MDEQIKNTHEIFFKYITPNKLDEFLKRSDSSIKYLQKQINKQLKIKKTNCFSNVFTEKEVDNEDED